jgi:hypothetical protein
VLYNRGDITGFTFRAGLPMMGREAVDYGRKIAHGGYTKKA